MESRPGAVGDVVTQYRNSEGELATIERCRGEAFLDQLVLCIYDDATPTVAMMLLDEGTADWLFDFLGTSKVASRSGE